VQDIHRRSRGCAKPRQARTVSASETASRNFPADVLTDGGGRALAVQYMWLARRRLFLHAFGDTWIWPLLGVLFLPLTTLTWAHLGTSDKRGRRLLVVPAVLIDLSRLGVSGHANRNRASRRPS
jgi:hypothetical protein